uniref:growth factor receptor-bound protein 10-like n=1 Tax=Myxine glutinosa TaxID=7769 RepID=UPI00358DF9E5
MDFQRHLLSIDERGREREKEGEGERNRERGTESTCSDTDDDVDLEALVNGMSAAFDGVRGLVESGLSGSPRSASPHVSSPSSSPHPITPDNTLNQRFPFPSQPMHIKSVRRLLEDERQSSSLPARPSVMTSSCTSPLLDRGLPRPCLHSPVQGLLPAGSLETLRAPSSSSTVTK